MSIDVFSIVSYFIGTTGGFEGVVISFTMIESSHASTKTKMVAGII
jgi:hypothetical protein